MYFPEAVAEVNGAENAFCCVCEIQFFQHLFVSAQSEVGEFLRSKCG